MTVDCQLSPFPAEAPRIDVQCEYQSCGNVNATLSNSMDHHLILDLDHTLISSFEFGESSSSRAGVNTVSPILANEYVDEFGLPEMYHATISNIVVLIKLRPHVRRFLRTAASSGLKLHVYTKGRRAYMREIIRLIDPDGVITGRHISRDDEPHHFKDYQKDPVLIDDSFVPHNNNNITILDDSPNVWSMCQHYSNVIAAKRYTFTDGFVSFLRSMGKTLITQYPRDSDSYLLSPLFDQEVFSQKRNLPISISKFAPAQRTMTSTSTTASEDDSNEDWTSQEDLEVSP